jgi:O-antigen ligase
VSDRALTTSAWPLAYAREASAERSTTRPLEIIHKPEGGKWLFFFLICFTVAIYARPEDIFPSVASFHLPLLLGSCAGLAFLGSLLSHKIRLIWPRELKIVILLTAWYIAGVPWAFWRTGSLHTIENTWMRTFLIFFLLVQTLVSLPRIRKLLWAIILCELAITSFTVLDRSHAVWAGDRLFGFSLGFFGWNFLGFAIAMTLPYIAVLFVRKRSVLPRVLLLSTLAFAVWMLILTASRGGLLNLLFSMLLTAVLVLRVTSRGRILLVALALGLMVACLLAPKVLWDRLGTLWGETDSNSVAMSAESSTTQRTDLLKESLQYAAENPLFGLGVGNFHVASGSSSNVWLVTHDTFTQIACEAGIPAFLLFVGLYVVVLRRMRSVARAKPRTAEESDLRLMARATEASVLSFAFSCFFASMGYDYYIFYLVAIAVGIHTIASRNPQSQPKDAISNAAAIG